MSKAVIVFIILLVVAILIGGLIFVVTNNSANTNDSNANGTVNTNRAANTNQGVNLNVDPTANTNTFVLNRNANSASRTNTNTATNASAAVNTNTSLPSGPASISVTGNGFSPKSLTVNAGQEVTWTNNDNVVHYVAPNDYPSHQRYSGIWDDDGTGRIGPGETYRVTISTPGTYLYHDHLDSTLTGTLIVR